MVAKSFFVTLCIIGLGFLTSEGNPEPLRSDYAYYSQAGGWLKLHLTPATWKNARRECIREGAVLASPENENLEEAIFNVLHQYRQQRFTIFTGIHDTYANGQYYSVEGAPLSRMPVRWPSDAEKHNVRPNDCLHWSMPDGEMTHGACHDELPFICFMRRTPAAACRMTNKDYKYDKRTRRCYKFHMDKLKWSEAFATCSTEGGHLAVINSDTEAQVLRELYAKVKAMSKNLEEVVHLGFTDLGDHDLWVTIHDYKYDKRTRRCYKFHMDKLKWSEAFATCSTEGGHLAVINSDTEAQVLRELYAKAKAMSKNLEEVVHLGFTDLGDHDLWVTIHEQTVKEAGYDKWGPGQPTRQDSHCGAMYGKGGKLDDFFCTADRAYICEMDPEKLFYENTLVDGQQV